MEQFSLYKHNRSGGSDWWRNETEGAGAGAGAERVAGYLSFILRISSIGKNNGLPQAALVQVRALEQRLRCQCLDTRQAWTLNSALRCTHLVKYLMHSKFLNLNKQRNAT